MRPYTSEDLLWSVRTKWRGVYVLPWTTWLSTDPIAQLTFQVWLDVAFPRGTAKVAVRDVEREMGRALEDALGIGWDADGREVPA